jgi:hypothetical protein
MTYPQGTNARLIEVAAAEVGTVEEGNNLTKYGKFTKADGLPWCGSFVNWCAAQAGVKIHSVVGTAQGAHKFKEIQRWSGMPQLGYLAFMDFPHDGVDRISHIGIVVGLIDTKTCLTIEGNTSGTGDQRNGGMVMVKVRSYGEGKEIVGFGIPKFVPYTGEFPNSRSTKIGSKTDKGEKMDKAKALAASWARSFMAAALALYMAGVTDPKTLAMAGVAAVAPVILRWLNPQDKSFGLTGK